MDCDCRLFFTLGVQNDHFQHCAVTGWADEQHPITSLPYRLESMLDGVPDSGVGDAVFSRALRDLHYGNSRLPNDGLTMLQCL